MAYDFYHRLRGRYRYPECRVEDLDMATFVMPSRYSVRLFHVSRGTL